MNAASLRRLDLQAGSAAQDFARLHAPRKPGSQRLARTLPTLRWRRAMPLALRFLDLMWSRKLHAIRSTWQLHMHLPAHPVAATCRGGPTAAQGKDVPRERPPWVRPRSQCHEARVPAGHSTVPGLHEPIGRTGLNPAGRVVPLIRSSGAAYAERPPPMARMRSGSRPVPVPHQSRTDASGIERAATANMKLRLHRPRANSPQAAAAGAEQRVEIEAQARRSPTLQWRGREPAQSGGGLSTSVEVGSAPSGHARVRVPTAPAGLNETPTARAAIQQIDPVLVERLADDVIGRIDRRLRIERERRGL